MPGIRHSMNLGLNRSTYSMEARRWLLKPKKKFLKKL
jgi:hypothetical protein